MAPRRPPAAKPSRKLPSQRTRTGLPGEIRELYREAVKSEARPLRELHGDAIAWLIAAAEQARNPYPYLIVPGDAENQNVEMSPADFRKLKRLADDAHVPLRAVLYTALYEWITGRSEEEKERAESAKPVPAVNPAPSPATSSKRPRAS